MAATKILFVIADANRSGGTEILAFNLLHSLNNEGLTCYLLSVVPYSGNDPYVISLTKLEYQRWKNRTFKVWDKLCGGRFSDSILRSIIISKAKSLNAKWIINHTYDFASAIPCDSMIHTAQIFHWSIRGYEESLKKIIDKKKLVNRAFSNIGFYFTKKRWHRSFINFDRLILLTNSACTEIKEVSPFVHQEQFSIIPNPLLQTMDSKCISTLCNNNLIFVGRLSFEKGVMRLLRIWERVYKFLPEYTLSIYGEGDAQVAMENYISEHNLPRIYFKGFCRDLKNIYFDSDLLLMTSDTEGFGMVLIEAMYYGVPCISFDCPVSPKEIISDAGMIIPCFDEIKYANTLIDILKDKKKLYDLQGKSVIRARNYFLNEVIKGWKKLIIS